IFLAIFRAPSEWIETQFSQSLMYISGKTFHADVTRSWTAETGPGGLKPLPKAHSDPNAPPGLYWLMKNRRNRKVILFKKSLERSGFVERGLFPRPVRGVINCGISVPRGAFVRVE